MTVFVSDTFTDPDDVLLTAHSPDVGEAWVVRSGTSPKISSNELIGQTSLCAITNAAVPGNADYDITISWTGQFGVSAGLLARFTDMSNRYYAYYWDSGGAYVLLKKVAGSFTQLDSSTEAAPGLPVAVLFELRSSGTTLDYKVGGVSKVSSADTSLTVAGEVGIFIQNAGDKLDDFVADDQGEAESTNASMESIKVWRQR